MERREVGFFKTWSALNTFAKAIYSGKIEYVDVHRITSRATFVDNGETWTAEFDSHNGNFWHFRFWINGESRYIQGKIDRSGPLFFLISEASEKLRRYLSTNKDMFLDEYAYRRKKEEEKAREARLKTTES